MEIKLIKTVEESISIELPIFWKHKTESKTEYLGIIDEKNVIAFYKSPTYTTFSNCELWLKGSEVKEAFSKWENISEDEFLDAHETFIQSLSLTPKII